MWIVTYIKTMCGWAYKATVIDLYSRKLIGWAIADHFRSELVTTETLVLSRRGGTLDKDQ